MKLKLASLALLATATFASAQAPAAAPAADITKSLVDTSTALFTAYQQMDQALFLSIIAPDFVFISRWGVLGPEELGGVVQGCSMTAFKLSDTKARQLSPDSAVLLYKVHQTANCGGKAEPTDLVVSDVFVRKGVDWLMTVHTQAGVEK